MFSSSITLSTLAIVGGALAQTSTVTLYIPGADPQSLVGTVVGTASSLTTYALQCANTDECGFPGQFTVTENASTAKYTVDPENGADGVLAFTGRVECSLDSTVSAVCVESFGGTEANFPGVTTETYTGTDFQYMPVYITAGAAAGTGSTPSSTVASTTSGASSSQTSNLATKTSSSASSSEGSSNKVAQTTSADTSTSTAGVPAVTGNAKWVVGGAAAALAMMV
ncbi:hypothetical protein DL95DRAFT_105613 [Leptodontidium sp. 2 PMI_412]|nr:hypothetical protein DL95DRAFT_105613 [Leptodontidium sp. 2 PMI_412]